MMRPTQSRSTRAISALAVLCATALGAFVSATAQAAEPTPLKVYISVDMEGIAGVVTADQLLPSGFEYERFRRFMTDEAVAAAKAAIAAGAVEVLVSDSHGNGESLLIESFPKQVRLVRSWPRHGGMMAGLDSGFAAALFVGYHASTTNPHGVRAHTFSSATFTRVALNGKPVTEGEFNAAYAGDLGVPVIFASGDDAAMAEIKASLGDLETVVTKRSLGFHSADSLVPAAATEQIYAGVTNAMTRRGERRPYHITHPVTLEVSFKNYMPAELLTYLHAVERVDSHTIRFKGRDMAEVSDFLDFIDRYSPELAP
jgi:D-amino peptidase